MGTVWSCLYLVGLGASRPFDPRDLKLPKIFLRLAGLLLLTLALFRVQSISLNPWMPTRGSLDKIEAEALPENLSIAEQKGIFDRALSWAPLDVSLYFRLGLIGLYHPEISSHSEDDFNRVLYLEQNSVEIPIAIGNFSAQSDFPEAMRAWRQVLQRAGDRREQLFRNIIYQNLDEKERYEISTLAGNDPQLQALAVTHQDSPDFEWYLQRFLDTNPSLQGVSELNLRMLLDRWVQMGDVDQLIKEWPLHPEWQEPGWRAYARALAKTGHEREALTTAFHFMSAPDMPHLPAPQDLDNAEDQFRANPQDPYSGILLYSAQQSRGLQEQAIDTLIALDKLPQPPAYIPYLLAKDLLQADQDKAAWQVLEPMLDDQ
jgi:hypothetical protein